MPKVSKLQIMRSKTIPGKPVKWFLTGQRQPKNEAFALPISSKVAQVLTERGFPQEG